MSDGFAFLPTGSYPAADTLDYVGELIAAAATAVVAVDDELVPATTGSTLAYIVHDLAQAWATVGRELVEATTQLSSLVVDTASCYLSVDADQAYRFAPVLHHA